MSNGDCILVASVRIVTGSLRTRITSTPKVEGKTSVQMHKTRKDRPACIVCQEWDDVALCEPLEHNDQRAG